MNLTTELPEDDYFRKMISEYFAAAPIDHGEWFDDGRRWCGMCNHPRFMCEPIEGMKYADKTCRSCSCLWPEFVSMVADDIENDEDFSEFFDEVLLN